nr:hypothetical protein [uncultured Methanolobus sp.]
MILKLEMIDKNMEIFYNVFDECLVYDLSGNQLAHYTVESEEDEVIVISNVTYYKINKKVIELFLKFLDDSIINLKMRKIKRMGNSIGMVLNI